MQSYWMNISHVVPNNSALKNANIGGFSATRGMREGLKFLKRV